MAQTGSHERDSDRGTHRMGTDRRNESERRYGDLPNEGVLRSRHGEREREYQEREGGPQMDYEREREPEIRKEGAFGQHQHRSAHANATSMFGASAPLINDPLPRSFRGVGPKGYLRSDEDVREDLCEALMRDEHVDPSDVEVTVRDGQIILDGVVPSRQMKYIVDDLAHDVSGAKDVINRLRVKRSEHR